MNSKTYIIVDLDGVLISDRNREEHKDPTGKVTTEDWDSYHSAPMIRTYLTHQLRNILNSTKGEYEIICMTSKPARYGKKVVKFLREYITYHVLYMRNDNDLRSITTLKQYWLQDFIESTRIHHFNPVLQLNVVVIEDSESNYHCMNTYLESMDNVKVHKIGVIKNEVLDTLQDVKLRNILEEKHE